MCGTVRWLCWENLVLIREKLSLYGQPALDLVVVGEIPPA